jgi:uncharacterized protein
MTWLLDGNVLVALAIDTHEFHNRVLTWFDAQSEPFATCAVTEGTLLRVHMRLAADRSAAAAWAVLNSIHAMEAHQFWDDGFSYLALQPGSLTGWAQVTDAWLAELARRKRAKLATLDAALAVQHGDVAFLLP